MVIGPLFINNKLLAALCRGGILLWSAKVVKALRHPMAIGSSNEPFARSLSTSKKQWHFVFCRVVVDERLWGASDRKLTPLQVCQCQFT